MYRRPTRGEFEYPRRTPWYEVPADASAYAIGPGTVARVLRAANGWAVEVRHGEVLGYRDLTVVYRHLQDPRVMAGDGVLGGTNLGRIDRDRRNPRGINHLHWEVWEMGRALRRRWSRRDKRHGVDPMRLLKRLRHWG